ncbi:MFS transporter [Nonomuraea sp. NPDC001831]|uniref:MFS transporter n=1 Tax=Nonomuraea sp. NPDC001831 TaxID=3364340 RepID=UPI0036B0DDA8
MLATPTSLSANSTTTVIPALAHALGISAADATWAATAFGWGGVLGAPLTAALLRTRGSRVATLANAALVLLGTLLVALAPALPMLLAGRAAQAAGGGGLVTLAITLAGTTSRTGVITAGVGLVGAFGPLVGSTLSAISWRTPLLLSLLALLAVPAVLRHAPAHRHDHDAGPTDIVGILLVMTLISAFILTPRLGPATLAAAAIATALLTLHIRRNNAGFIPRAVVSSRMFIIASATACALSTSYFALLYTVPRMLERHWPAERIGLATLVMLAAGSIASLLFTRRTSRYDPALTRTILLTAGAVAVALPLTAPWPTALVAANAFAVFAATAAMAWYSDRAGKAVPGEHRATALALFTLCYQLGGAFGPALASLLIA